MSPSFSIDTINQTTDTKRAIVINTGTYVVFYNRRYPIAARNVLFRGGSTHPKFIFMNESL